MTRYILSLAVIFGAFACSPVDRAVGAACDSDRDCRDRCLTDWPGGFCTLECRDDRDCPPEAVCSDTRGGVCLLTCDVNRDCQDMLDDNDYRCDDRRNVEGGRDEVCVPD